MIRGVRVTTISLVLLLVVVVVGLVGLEVVGVEVSGDSLRSLLGREGSFAAGEGFGGWGSAVGVESSLGWCWSGIGNWDFTSGTVAVAVVAAAEEELEVFIIHS